MKNIPLAAAILFLAAGGFLIWQQARQTVRIADMRVWMPQEWHVGTTTVSDSEYVLTSPDFDGRQTKNNILGDMSHGAFISVQGSYLLESGPVSETYLDKVVCSPGQQACTIQKTNYHSMPGRITRLVEAQAGLPPVYVVDYIAIHNGRIYEAFAKYVEKDKTHILNDIFSRIRPE